MKTYSTATKKMDSHLVKSIQTKIAARDLVRQLSDIDDNLHNKKKADNSFSNHLTEKQRSLLLNDLKLNHISPEDSAATSHYIKSLIAAITELPVLTLEIAFYPRAAFVDEISDRLISATNNQVLLEVNVNPDIVAGLILYNQGRCYDYSLKRKLKCYEII